MIKNHAHNHNSILLKLGNLRLNRGEVLLPRRHCLLERDDLGDAVDHLLHQAHLRVADALFVRNVELVLHRGGVFAGRSPWLKIKLVAHL